MDKKRIVLHEDNSLIFWSGNKYGREIYNEQVKKQLKDNYLEEGIVIELPEQIEFINYSFVQGFFAEVSDEIGKNNVRSKITLESAHKDLVDSVWDKLLSGPSTGEGL